MVQFLYGINFALGLRRLSRHSVSDMGFGPTEYCHARSEITSAWDEVIAVPGSKDRAMYWGAYIV